MNKLKKDDHNYQTVTTTIMYMTILALYGFAALRLCGFAALREISCYESDLPPSR